MKFFDREYELLIGDAETGEGLLINNSLKVEFKITKTKNNKDKADTATLSITNLSDSSLAVLEQDYPVARFSCGYQGNIVQLFSGQVTDVKTKKRGPDRITQLRINPSYTELTHKLMSEVVPENSNVENVIEAIRKNIDGLAKGVYKGSALKLKTVYGYPLTGTPRQMLDQVCSVYDLEWRIENEALYINSYETVSNSSSQLAPVISPASGLIDAPYNFSGSEGRSSDDSEKTRGIQVKALLNPNVVPGSVIKIEYKDEDDFYKVEQVDFMGDYRGEPWYMTCTCLKTPEVE